MNRIQVAILVFMAAVLAAMFLAPNWSANWEPGRRTPVLLVILGWMFLGYADNAFGRFALLTFGLAMLAGGGFLIYLLFKDPWSWTNLGFGIFSLLFGFGTTANALFPSRSAKCPACGAHLKSDQAKQCFKCGYDWHEANAPRPSGSEAQPAPSQDNHSKS